jgi:two-component system CheB/CheR fusion protein
MPKKMARQTRSRSAKTRPRQAAPRAPVSSERPARATIARSQSTRPLMIAGVGASAGGLEAFSQLLQAFPADPGLAVVFVQHLAPQHESVLPILLAARTALTVVQAVEGMTVQRNHVYVIPPNVQMSIQDDALHLVARPTDRSQYMPIDYFLHSLAESAQDRAIGVILSGTASDGAVGVREIKAVGGITIAQHPETAKYDGMPRAAIASGFIDLVLSPSQIAAELVSIIQHPLKQSPILETSTTLPAPDETDPTREPQMDQIFGMLRSASGVDFRRYKRATIARRMQRRMVLHKLTNLDHYVRYARENPAEVQGLYDDILIHVTRFFRDADVFESLATEILPKILERQSDEQAIRVWVPGCSTGEEAYTAAIVILETLAQRSRGAGVQVFATDISDASIVKARSGTYPESIAVDITPERLRHFFTKVDGAYRVNKAVRDVCVFARQDLTRDPPFSKVDIILCRNVLIYMGNELQKKLMGVFYYALKPSGFLVLGNAETIGPNSNLFSPADRKHRIYERKSGAASDRAFQLDYAAHPIPEARAASPRARDAVKTVDQEAGRLIQERYAPPAVLVDRNFTVVQFRGQTGTFLEPAPGEPSMNLLKMLREGLLHGVRDALQAARKTSAPVRKRGLRVRANGGWHEVDVDVLPLMSSEQAHFLVLFDESNGTGAKARARGETKRAGGKTAAARRGHHATAAHPVERLAQELASSREYLQSIIQDLEAANEELQSANEEILSANEELQSTNEELDTAKEELQSTNEELNTVNEELHARNEELSRVNSDLINLLSSVQIAIVIVANDLRIRRFTPMAERVLNLIASDIGRPIGHIKPNIDCPDLEDLIMKVIDSVTPCELEVRDRQGNELSLRIRPYKNLENRIDGAVLALFETESVQRGEIRLADNAGAVLDAVQQPLVLLDAQLRVRRLNRAFEQAFGIASRDAVDRLIYALDGEQWNIPRLRTLLEDELKHASAVERVEIDINNAFPASAPKRMLISARRLGGDGEREPLVVLALEDKTA